MEEVPVSKLVSDFPDNRKRVDWFIKDLNLVIEVCGEQHFSEIAFGGDLKKSNYVSQVHRDVQKATALKQAGYLFLEIPYWDNLTLDYLESSIRFLIQRGDIE